MTHYVLLSGLILLHQQSPTELVALVLNAQGQGHRATIEGAGVPEQALIAGTYQIVEQGATSSQFSLSGAARLVQMKSLHPTSTPQLDPDCRDLLNSCKSKVLSRIVFAGNWTVAPYELTWHSNGVKRIPKPYSGVDKSTYTFWNQGSVEAGNVQVAAALLLSTNKKFDVTPPGPGGKFTTNALQILNAPEVALTETCNNTGPGRVDNHFDHFYDLFVMAQGQARWLPELVTFDKAFCKTVLGEAFAQTEVTAMSSSSRVKIMSTPPRIKCPPLVSGF